MTPPSAGCRSARAPPTSKCFRESAGDRAGAQDPAGPPPPGGPAPRPHAPRRPPPPALRRPRMGRVPGGFAGGGAPGAPLAPPGLRGGQEAAEAGLTAPAGSARGSTRSIFTSGTRSQAAAVKAALIPTSHWYPTVV